MLNKQKILYSKVPEKYKVLLLALTLKEVQYTGLSKYPVHHNWTLNYKRHAQGNFVVIDSHSLESMSMDFLYV